MQRPARRAGGERSLPEVRARTSPARRPEKSLKISSTERGLEETGVGACSRRERLGRGTAATVADEAMAHTHDREEWWYHRLREERIGGEGESGCRLREERWRERGGVKTLKPPYI